MKKKITCLAVSFFTLCMSFLPLPVSAADADLEYEDLTYIIQDENAVITGCADETEALVIPEKIGENPVTAVQSSAFTGHTALKSAVLPDSLTDLGDRAFTNCTALESVRLPVGLTAVKHNTFNGCSALENIVIPDTVRTIGTGAFQDCSALADITFPKQLDRIQAGAFADTAWINAQPEGYVSVSNVLCCYQGTMPENTELKLDTNITVIADGAFSGETNLKAVTFHDKVTLIGWGAFHHTGVVNVTLPPVAKIESHTFSECDDLKSVTIPGSVETIDMLAFSACRSLEEVTLCEGIKDIEPMAFSDCTSLKSIKVPASVQEIGGSAFGYYSDDNPDGGMIIFLNQIEGFTIYGYKDSAAEEYASRHDFLFIETEDPPAAVRGDVNCDGVFNTADAVLLQKWLLAISETVLADAAAADFNEDGKLNAIDLNKMKQELIQK